MINILKQHLAHYPDMQIQDVAKLLYQSEFGGGHMIADEAGCFSYLQREYAALDSDSLSKQPVVEPIGKGMCRIYLSAINQGLSLSVLNEMFIRSANEKKGSVDGLQEKIDLFLEACLAHECPFSYTDAKHFCEEWKTKGYPALHHSAVYREAYHPSYRVVDESYARVLNLIPRIQLDEGRTFIVAIDGMSGSGKSTLGELLHLNFPSSNLFHMDDFFLRPCQRTPARLAEVGGNVDYERFKEEILDHINDHNGLSYRPYNCQIGQLGAEIHVPWQPLAIIEGSYSQHPYFEDIFHLKVSCKISAEEQKLRILKRNGTQMWQRFEQEWIPKENLYFETFHI